MVRCDYFGFGFMTVITAKTDTARVNFFSSSTPQLYVTELFQIVIQPLDEIIFVFQVAALYDSPEYYLAVRRNAQVNNG